MSDTGAGAVAEALSDDVLLRYSRHIMLDELGEAGQRRLGAARAVVVGLGGLGSPAAMYLAAAGVGELLLCDDDVVDLTNLQRQLLHDTDGIGLKKTDSAAARLRRLNPHCRAQAAGRVCVDNADELLAGADVVIDGSDNYASRHLVNRVCARHGVPLVFGAATGFDGQAAVFDVRQSESPCYNCLFCEDDQAADTPCALLGVLAPLTGIVGSVMAAEAIKILAGVSGGLLGRLLLLDARDMRWRSIAVPRDPACAVCHAR